MILRFGATFVKLTGEGTEVMLPSGSVVYGRPHTTEEYTQTAREFGYGEDVLALNNEHETTHCALAELIGLAASPTLRHVAGDCVSSPEVLAAEEAAVLAIQRFARIMKMDLIEVYSKKSS